MRAWQLVDGFGFPHLRQTDLPEPQPGPGEVAVGVRAVSLNFRDLLVVKGLYNKKLPLPLTICSDAAGQVKSLGPGVTRFRSGDRVAATFMPGWIGGEPDEAKARTALGAAAQGVLAETVLFSEQALVPLPDHLDWPEAATLPCAGVTAWNALFDKGRLRAGETVLVMGSGGVSLFALQFARMAGARVIATTGNSDKIPRLKQFGASEVIHYRENPDWEEHVRKWAGGGVDHVIEVGGAGTLAKSVRAVRMGGKIHLIGNLASLDGLTGFNPLPAMMKGITIQGIFVGSREMFEQMARAVAANRIHPVVDRVFPFDAAPEALGHIESGSHFGKVCIHVNAG